MATLKETIQDRLKECMKKSDSTGTLFYRSILSSIIEHEKLGKGITVDDEHNILKRNRKILVEQQEWVKKAEGYGWEDDVKTHDHLISIIDELLPKMMSREEIVSFVKNYFSSNQDIDKSNQGKIMGIFMKELKGKAEGALVKEVILENI